MKMTEADKHALVSCKDVYEYNKAARSIKAANGGVYPDDWWAMVFAQGGIAEQLEKKWGKPGALGVRAEYLTDEDIISGKF